MKTKGNLSNRKKYLFEVLRRVLALYEKELVLVVLADQEDTYYVDIQDNIHDQHFFFGAVQQKGAGVVFYFANLPKLSELLRTVTIGIPIIQNTDGGNCLIFKTITADQLRQLKQLMKIYADQYRLSIQTDQDIPVKCTFHEDS